MVYLQIVGLPINKYIEIKIQLLELSKNIDKNLWDVMKVVRRRNSIV